MPTPDEARILNDIANKQAMLEELERAGQQREAERQQNEIINLQSRLTFPPGP